MHYVHNVHTPLWKRNKFAPWKKVRGSIFLQGSPVANTQILAFIIRILIFYVIFRQLVICSLEEPGTKRISSIIGIVSRKGSSFLVLSYSFPLNSGMHRRRSSRHSAQFISTKCRSSHSLYS